MKIYTQCKKLGWPILSVRRDYLSLIECSKNKYTHQSKLARVNSSKYSFFVRIIRLWNSLPSNVVEVESISVFKSSLSL